MLKFGKYMVVKREDLEAIIRAFRDIDAQAKIAEMAKINKIYGFKLQDEVMIDSIYEIRESVKNGVNVCWEYLK